MIKHVWKVVCPGADYAQELAEPVAWLVLTQLRKHGFAAWLEVRCAGLVEKGA